MPRPNSTWTSTTYHELCKKLVTVSEREQEIIDKCDEGDDRYCWPKDTRCQTHAKPIDFIYDYKKGVYDLDKYKTDEELVRKIQTGKGDPLWYDDELGNNLFIEMFFGGTTPINAKQDYIYGDNDLTGAKAARYEVA